MTMFGDLEPDDVFDGEPTIAPEQLARKLHGLRVALARLAGDDEPDPWHQLSTHERQLAIALMVLIVDWLKREGPR